MEYKNFIKGKEIRSENFWRGGKTMQARQWRWSMAARERQGMKLEIKNAKRKEPLKSIQPPYEILLFRIAPGKFDKDNLTGGFKHIRDGIADGLGYNKDDEHPDLEWKYFQIKCKKGQEAINIIIRHKEVK